MSRSPVALTRSLIDRVFPTRRAPPLGPELRLLRRWDRPEPGLRQHLRGRCRARRLQRRVPHPRDRPRRPRRRRPDGAVRADLHGSLRRDDERAANDFGRTVLTAAVLVMVVAVIVILSRRTVAGDDRSARASTRPTRDLYVDLLRINCLAQILFAASICLGEVLVANRRFLFYALAPILYTAGIIVGTVLGADTLRDRRDGMGRGRRGRPPSRRSGRSACSGRASGIGPAFALPDARPSASSSG